METRIAASTPNVLVVDDDPQLVDVISEKLREAGYTVRQAGSATEASSLFERQRPDLVYIATEGPLGWSALQIAHKLKLPVCSDFRTNFHAYSRHYGIGWLYRPIMGYLRKFHNRTAFTMVPSESLRQQLRANGFERLVLVARGVDTDLFTPARRSDALSAAMGGVCTRLRAGPRRSQGRSRSESGDPCATSGARLRP